MSEDTTPDSTASQPPSAGRDDAPPRSLDELASGLGLSAEACRPHGHGVAKVDLQALEALPPDSPGRYIHVTSMTPMPGRQDPTCVALALADALAGLGKRAAACVPQPSIGEVMMGERLGAGAGPHRIVPLERFAMHLTGDLHAVSTAHALLSSLADIALVKAGPDGLDTRRMAWRRAQEMIDPALREVVAGLGGGGVPRESGFALTTSSEVMAILTLAKSVQDLRDRLSRIVVGYSHHELPLFAHSIRADQAMAAVLAEAIRPNLMQTAQGTPVFVHGAADVQLGHGASSVLADRLALGLAEFVVTVSQGGAELGLEKFCDIKCRASGLAPSAVVMLADVRGVKYQSGRYRGGDDARLAEPSLQAVKEGAANLAKHLENVRYFGLPCVVVLLRGEHDTEEELDALRSVAQVSGADSVVVGRFGADDTEGAEALARAVADVCAGKTARFSYLYDGNWPITKKIETIATTLYNAGQVRYSARARTAIERCMQLGWQELSIGMVKTMWSLSHDPHLLGRPYDFTLPVQDVEVAAGAGMLLVHVGDVAAMPDPARQPRAFKLGLDDAGRIKGLTV